MHKQVFARSFPYPSVVYYSNMDLEQTVKDLQAQNSQFQQLLLTLAKGQEELKTLLEKEKEEEASRCGCHGQKV